MGQRRSTCGAIALVGCLWLATGCASVESKGRTLARVAALRGVDVEPADVDEAVRLDAGTDVMSDDDLARAQHALGEQLGALVSSSAAKASRRVGTVHVIACELRAGVDAREALYVARCRLGLRVMATTPGSVAREDIAVDEHSGVDVVIAQAEVVRRVRIAAVTRAQLLDAMHAEPNPLLSVDDAGAALHEALATALSRVLHDDGDVVRRTATAARARGRLHDPSSAIRAASAVDLGDSGTVDDGPLLLPLLIDEDGRVRRAATEASGLLCAATSVAALEARNDDEEVPASIARDAAARARACMSLALTPD